MLDAEAVRRLNENVRAMDHEVRSLERRLRDAADLHRVEVGNNRRRAKPEGAGGP